jgi:hypothetical protein
MTMVGTMTTIDSVGRPDMDNLNRESEWADSS